LKTCKCFLSSEKGDWIFNDYHIKIRSNSCLVILILNAYLRFLFITINYFDNYRSKLVLKMSINLILFWPNVPFSLVSLMHISFLSYIFLGLHFGHVSLITILFWSSPSIPSPCYKVIWLCSIRVHVYVMVFMGLKINNLIWLWFLLGQFC
jgi:hypothetical protein